MKFPWPIFFSIESASFLPNLASRAATVWIMELGPIFEGVLLIVGKNLLYYRDVMICRSMCSVVHPARTLTGSV